MQFLFLLLLCTQSFFATLASSYDPDKWDRGVSEIRYTVHATDPTKTHETEALLKNAFGTDNVIKKQLDNGIPTWSIISHGDDLTDAINQFDVVRIEESATVPQSQSSKPRRRPGRRDYGVYMAVPIPGSDLKKIDDSIQSKVQPGTEVDRVVRGERIMAWCGLHLDPEARIAVKNFEGVEGVDAEMVSHYNIALPARSMVLTNTSLMSLSKRDRVSRRAGEWAKQEKADDALVTVSEYP
jgi:hypothetical protein